MIYYCPVCDAEVRSRYEFCPNVAVALLVELQRGVRRALRQDPPSQGEAVETDEFARIEYLLEALKQAREWGELSRSAYRLLAQRYLHRAQEIGLKPSEKAGATPAVASTEPATRLTPASDNAVGTFDLPSLPRPHARHLSLPHRRIGHLVRRRVSRGRHGACRGPPGSPSPEPYWSSRPLPALPSMPGRVSGPLPGWAYSSR